jgi:hypothetical protein
VTASGWTTEVDVRTRLEVLWARGRLLASVAVPDDTFPLRVPLKGPRPIELSTRFDEARAWIAGLQSARHLRVQLRQVNHRQLGTNDVPAELWVDTVDDAAAIVGKTRDLQRFRAIAATTAARRPELMPLLARRPLDALAAAGAWPRLLDVVDWLRCHPRPGFYLRQVDVPGVHTKFVQAHQRLLVAMLDAALPADAIDTTARPADFVRRFGFRSRPRLVRFRLLDAGLSLTATGQDHDYTLTATDFGRVAPTRRVFITENEVNFLAFPDATDAMVVFGAGSGLDHLAQAAWLAGAAVYYWGDIDTHGMAILDQLRGVVPHAASLMMDRVTLMAHRDYWGREESPTRRDLRRLGPDELDLYNDLRDNRVQANLRLEQERVRFGWVRRAVAATGSSYERVDRCDDRDSPPPRAGPSMR